MADHVCFHRIKALVWTDLFREFTVNLLEVGHPSGVAAMRTKSSIAVEVWPSIVVGYVIHLPRADYKAIAFLEMNCDYRL